MTGHSDKSLNIESPLSLATFNVRGINSTKKRTSIIRSLKREKIDIVALQETYLVKTQDYEEIQRQWGGNLHFNSGSNRSKGVITLFSPSFESDDISILYKSEDGRVLISSLKFEKEHFLIVNVYSPCDETHSKIEFLNDLLIKLTTLTIDYSDASLICLGDFNIALGDLDIIVGAQHHKDTVTSLNNFIHTLGILDTWRLTHPSDKTYTWSRNNPTAAKRLDYIFASELLSYAIKESCIKDIGFSDHRLVMTRFEFSSFKYGKGVYKLNTSLLKDLQYCKIINAGIAEVETDYQVVDDYLKWEIIKANASESSQLYGRAKSKIIGEKTAELQKTLNFLENEFIDNPNDDQITAQIARAKSELEIYEHEKSKGAAIRARIKYIEEGEKCTNYFLSMEKCRSKMNTIKRLKTETGRSIVNEKEIVNNIGNYFFKRFNNSTKTEEEIAEHFREFTKDIVLPKLTADEAQRLEADITEAELDSAVKSLEHGSAPGRDGLPIEFYIVFWQRLKRPFMACIRQCEEICRLTNSQRTGILSLFHKGSDLPTDSLENWRPLALLNSDYKIVAKVFSRRFDLVINSLIGNQQTGFLKGRSISYVHRQIDDMLTLHRQSNKPGILVAIDFKQAFDAINIPCILKSLELFGFGPRFINWIKILNTDRLFSVKNGGHISQTYVMQNGVRQGCPLSPQLFILVAEVLAQKIIQDKNIVGLRPPRPGRPRHDDIFDVILKILQYADDTSLFLSDLNSLKRAIEVFKSFSKCSDLHLNLRKSFAMSMNGDRIETDIHITFQDSIKILGIYYSNKKSASEIENNWSKRINKITKIFSRWSIRKLSIIGRIHIIKTFGLSQFVHIMQSISLPDHVLIEINQVFFRFLWNKQFANTRPSDKVKRSVITNDFDEGGLKMINMQLLQQAILLSWGEELLSQEDSIWKRIALVFLEPLGGKTVFKSKVTPKDMKYIQAISSPFWKSVLSAWLNHSGNHRNTYHSFNDPLFNNSFITFRNKPLFFQNCIKAGIVMIKDMTDNGNVLSFDQFVAKRGEHGGAFLEYFAILNALLPFIRRHSISHDDHYEFQGTPLKKLGRKFFYVAINHTDEPTSADFWIRNYNTELCSHYWQLIHSLKESRLRALVWKIAHNIYPTNSSLYKMKISETPLCGDCNVHDTLGHFFFHCKRVKHLWVIIQQKILTDLNTKIRINEVMALLGPAHLQGVNFSIKSKIKQIITVGLHSISKLKYGNNRNLNELFESECRLRNI